jgi:ABC-type phosphate/phosphonate transport system substrate-binding protein
VPAALTRDLDHRDIWRHEALLFGQACEYPIAKFLGNSLKLVATPRYSAPGCDGALYRSAIIVRADDRADSLAELRGRRCILNEPDSNSGMNLLRAAVAPLAGGVPFFKSVGLSGSHRRSVERVAANEADIAAIDCVTFAHLQRFHSRLTEKVRILCWSPASPSLPFVTAREIGDATVGALRSSLLAVLADSELRQAREVLFWEGVELTPDTSLSRVRQLERQAVELRYSELQ